MYFFTYIIFNFLLLGFNKCNHLKTINAKSGFIFRYQNKSYEVDNYHVSETAENDENRLTQNCSSTILIYFELNLPQQPTSTVSSSTVHQQSTILSAVSGNLKLKTHGYLHKNGFVSNNEPKEKLCVRTKK